MVGIDLLADDDYSTDGEMENTLMTLKNVSKKLFSEQKNLLSVTYYVDSSLKDQYGNIKNGLWFQVVLSGDTGYKINYDNLTPGEFGKLLDLWKVNGTLEAQTAFDQVVSQ